MKMHRVLGGHIFYSLVTRYAETFSFGQIIQ